jgi:hypothetical protein
MSSEFTVLRHGYNIPGQGWVCLVRPLELAGLPGTYGYCGRLAELQIAVADARNAEDIPGTKEALKRLEQHWQSLHKKVTAYPQDETREKLRELLEPSRPFTPPAALKQAA